MSQQLTPEQRCLVEEHMTEALIIARVQHRKHFKHLDFDDVLSWAHEGLVQAAMRFNPDHGVKFKTFLQFRVRGAIIDQVRHDSERLVSRQDFRNGVRRYEESIEALVEADPTWSPTSFDVDIDSTLDMREAMTNRLSERERAIISALAMGIAGTEIAEDLQITCSRVSQIASAARMKLKEAIAA